MSDSKPHPGVMLWRFSTDIQYLRDERRRDSGWTTDNLRKPGFAPKTVIDVGAQRGTRPLYEAFPESFHVLIEPLEEFNEHLERIAREVGGELVTTAVGDREGTATIHVDPRRKGISSILRISTLSREEAEHVEEREIPITTLDNLLDRQGWTGPFGLKIDVEGYELNVIEGATRLLAETQFVIAEVWMTERYEGGYSFAEFIALMDDRGFRLCDVLDGLKAKRGAETSYVDALFRRK